MVSAFRSQKVLSRVGVSAVLSSLALLFFAPVIALAAALPDCLSQGQVLPINNAQVLDWKTSTQNQFLARGHIKGLLAHMYPDHNGHTHMEVMLDSTPGHGIEVIYNQSFGALPTLTPGMVIESCGDYITSIAPTGKYPASPDGAILHWVHRGGGSHASGYVSVNGVVYGTGNGTGAFY
jgi:hypothetical protein